MDEKVIREPEDEIADVVGLVGRQLLEYRLDPSLVLVRRFRRLRRVARDQSLLHEVDRLVEVIRGSPGAVEPRECRHGAPSGYCPLRVEECVLRSP